MSDLSSVLLAITNYDFSANADNLKSTFARHVATVLIDASSPTPPSGTDVTIPNTMYGGLWDAAVSEAIARDAEWLFFIASDVEVPHPALLVRCMAEAIQDERVGVYTPSVDSTSRCSYRACFRGLTATARLCSVVEGFCFLARTRLLKTVHPVGNQNRYGWSIDKLISLRAASLGLLNVVDDRVAVHHPASLSQHTIDTASAEAEGNSFLARNGITSSMTRDALLLDQELSDQRRALYPIDTVSLDLGCGRHPRNPFNAKALFGVDVKPFEIMGVKQVKTADLATDQLPFSDASFDYITAFDVLEHIPRIIYCPNQRYAFIELMNQIYRCLKPGGLFLALTPAFPHKEAFQDPTHVNIITEDTFPKYFDDKSRWAEMYGFNGHFQLEHQSWQAEGKLLTVMRASPSHGS